MDLRLKHHLELVYKGQLTAPTPEADSAVAICILTNSPYDADSGDRMNPALSHTGLGVPTAP